MTKLTMDDIIGGKTVCNCGEKLVIQGTPEGGRVFCPNGCQGHMWGDYVFDFLDSIGSGWVRECLAEQDKKKS